MPVNLNNLVGLWIDYTKQNGISANGSEGRQPEDTDLVAFLQAQGFDPGQFQPLIDKLPEAEPGEKGSKPGEETPPGEEAPSSEEAPKGEVTPEQENSLQRIYKLIAKYTDPQRIMLKKELS